MKNIKKIALAYGMMAMGGRNWDYEIPRKSSPEELKREQELKLNAIKAHNGLREFFYKDCTVAVFALNQKNADKKAKKKGWI